MSALPPITVSDIDRERLYALLDHQDSDTEVVDRLYQELDRARFLAPEEMPADVVALNSRVRFRNEDTGKEHEMSLSMPQDVSNGPDRISILTPAGAALLGLTVGDNIEWPNNGKKLRLRLIEVSQG